MTEPFLTEKEKALLEYLDEAAKASLPNLPVEHRDALIDLVSDLLTYDVELRRLVAGLDVGPS